MARQRPLVLALTLLAAAALAAGCTNGSSSSRGGKNGGKNGNGNGASTVKVEFPEGDPSVSAEDGGPGFTGEGWESGSPKPLGDPRAVKGGAITVDIREWPGNLRMAGS